MIPFGPFEPSRSILNPGASPNILNCRPKADGWGPTPSHSTNGTALPAAPRGAIYARDNAGNVTLFAGTATALYKFDTGTSAWVDISGLSAPFAVPDGDDWSFVLFGEKLVATTIGSPPQVFDLSASSVFADLGGSPPRAKYAWVAGDFLALGHHVGAPNSVAWSGLNDIAFWTYGQRGSDIQTMPDGGAIYGGISGTSGAFVIQRSAIRYMQFDPGSGYTFTFRTLNARRGAVSPRSIVQIGSQDFVYLSEDGFFRGAEGAAIGAERVDDWFLGGEIDLDELAIVQGAYDPYQKIVWWSYLKGNGDTGTLGYDWHLDRWCRANLGVTYLFGALTPGTTWDGLDALYASIDAASAPFESRRFKGGRPTLSGFNTSNVFGYMTGPNLAATLETADIELAKGGRAFVNGFRVVSDAATYTGTVSVKDYHGDDATVKAGFAPSTITGLVPARANGRLHRFKVEIAAGAEWDHVHGVDPQVKGGGRR